MITVENGVILLKNDYIERILDTTKGFGTTRFLLRPAGEKQNDLWYPVYAFNDSLPFEAAVWFNNIRIHGSLGYLSPIDFKQHSSSFLCN